MAKARRILVENAPLVDVILEIVDARCPLASSNPDLMKLVADKARIKILNKADLADPNATRAWVDYFTRQGESVVALDAVRGTGAAEVLKGVRSAFAPRLAEWTKKGRKPRPARVMAVGIPNVGKSSAINRLAGARKAIVGDRPGVTRGKQWVRIGSDIELLDMPGILVPKFEEQRDGVILAAIGCIKEEIFDTREIAGQLLTELWPKVPDVLATRLGLESPSTEPMENLAAVGRARGLLKSGGTVDAERVAALVLREFRDGKLGRVTLQDPV